MNNGNNGKKIGGVIRKVFNIFVENRDRYITPADIQSYFSPAEKGGQSFMRFERWLRERHKLDIKQIHIEGNTYGYKLVTPLYKIDFDTITLKPLGEKQETLF